MMATQAKNGNERPRIGFEFEVIDLNTAYDLVPKSNRSKYKELKEGLILQMKTAPAAALRFGQLKPGMHELPERERRGICNACNDALRAEKMNYRVTYSGKGRCFVVIPFKRYNIKNKKKVVDEVAPATAGGDDSAERIFAVASQVFQRKRDVLLADVSIRRAIAYVALKQGFGPNPLRRIYGLQNAKRAAIVGQNRNMEEIAKLEKALTRRGA